MTQRRRLDAHLVEQASAAGADFRDGVKVTAVDEGGVVADGERIDADAIVGADGVNGVSARSLGLGGNREVGVALEGNVPFEKLGEGYRGALVLEIGVAPGGYGWVFPKGDHANVGIGGWGSEGPRLRGRLAELCAAHGIDVADLTDIRGYRLPCRAAGSPLSCGRTLVVGDAAGLVDPLSGDGMYEAFLSGQLAAEAVLDVLAGREETVEPYERRLNARLARHLWAAWSVKGALERFPRSAFALSRTRIVWRAVERVVRGDVADVTQVRGLARPPLKALALLARAAGDPGRAYRT
jgi:flavin-dependent dehydrogenase